MEEDAEGSGRRGEKGRGWEGRGWEGRGERVGPRLNMHLSSVLSRVRTPVGILVGTSFQRVDRLHPHDVLPVLCFLNRAGMNLKRDAPDRVSLPLLTLPSLGDKQTLSLSSSSKGRPN